MNYFDWIGKWAEYTPDKVAVAAADGSSSYTFKELHQASLKVENSLRKEFGVKEKDRLPVLAQHSPQFLILFLASQRMGAILVPLNYRSSAFEIQYCIEDIDPKLLFADVELFQNKLGEIKQKIDLPVISLKALFESAEKFSSNTSPSNIEPDRPVFIFYTSGTTGKPKGVLYTNRMLFWNSLNTSVQLEITSGDYTLNALPPYHTSGWNVLLLPMLHRGARVDFMSRFKAKKVLNYIENKQISLFLAIPTMLRMMVKNKNFQNFKNSNLRYMVVGGENLSIPIIDAWAEKGIMLRQGYGLTEAGPCITSLHHHDALWKKGSIGKPNFYVDYKIVNEQNEEVGVNEPGEFCIHGNIVTPGYWNNSTYTYQKIRDRWLHTGDIVRMDADGFMYVIGRKNQSYISGGVNIFPLEIEQVLVKRELVKEAAVIGVDDEQWGEVGVAFVEKNRITSEAEILKELKRYLASYKIPREIIFLDSLPKSGIGKIDRNKLKNDYNHLKNEKRNIV
ncbi:class I adenylate-forming enzyme family protein [Salinimicrobium sp. TH3]|uniref:class I adenylate-forming enzyme family protein n=1 Tax=Salinimicrobium sp. TH3 TaxID=2997342 RepID=UPI00227669B6|nr:AMP-binding protein [Salinimicrobium sp. TH3]MCY2685713.1 AMP-binding protein [Salinimicrobium sp. TH3]